MGSRRLHSDSDVMADGKLFRRESIADYLTSRRGSISDLVFSTNRKLSRDTFLARNSHSRHMSLTNQNSLLTSRDQKQRSSSLVSPKLKPVECLSREARSEYKNTSGNFCEKKFLKTRSLNNLLYFNTKSDDQKRNSKGQIMTNFKRRKLMKKLQSIQTFESVLKSRQNRRKFDVSTVWMFCEFVFLVNSVPTFLEIKYRLLKLETCILLCRNEGNRDKLLFS